MQTLTSWSVGINYYTAAANPSTDSADPFSAGTFTSPINGWYHISIHIISTLSTVIYTIYTLDCRYHICSFSRFRNTGNANDVTVLVVSGKYFLVSNIFHPPSSRRQCQCDFMA